MLRIEGKVNVANCYANIIEDEAEHSMPSRRHARDGSVLAVGKGNPDWNFSAPHGAGRLMSRTKAKEQLNFKASE